MIAPDNTRPLNDEQLAQFHRDGFYIHRQLFDAEEIGLLLTTARQDHNMLSHGIDINDAAGRASKLSLWNHPGDDIYGMFARGRRIVDGMEQILGGEVYHYHTKMMLKEPRVGGAWEWHQDYGYWYNNGCLFPDMASCLIAVDAATKANGCIQMMVGSHKMGRIEHGRYGGQTGADRDRVAEAQKRMEVVYCEADPGDAVYFHANTLHRSDANTSDASRWSLICCYNKATNNPYKEHHHPCYTPLEKVDDEAIKRMGAKGADASLDFMEPQEDSTTAGTKSK